jgi:dephospho-CoA kinase
MPLIIGVTGAIASGKSTVCEILQRLGAIHCDADKLVHRLYEPGTPGFDRVVAAFGPEIIGPDGFIDRRILGEKVFGQPEAMARLTAAIGEITPAIKRVVDDWRETLPGDAVAVLEAVNMIEPGYSAWLDQTWLIACDEERMRRRLARRNRFSPEEIERRLRSQRPWQARAPAADVVIQNNSTLERLTVVVEAEFAALLDRYRRGDRPESRWHAWRRMQDLLAVRDA